MEAMGAILTYDVQFRIVYTVLYSLKLETQEGKFT